MFAIIKRKAELRNKYQQSNEAVVVQPEFFKKKKKEMFDAERVFSLQSKLYQKAKQETMNANDEVYRKFVCGKTARTD